MCPVSDALEFLHSAIQLLPLRPTHLPIPSICRLLYSVVTAVRRGWVSHSFPRPVIAGNGCTLSFSQRGNHGSSHAWCYKSWRLERSVLNNYPSTTAPSLPHLNYRSDLILYVAHDYPMTPNILTCASSFHLYSCLFLFFSKGVYW